MLFCSLAKGIIPKICWFCLVPVNSVLSNLLCVLHCITLCICILLSTDSSEAPDRNPDFGTAGGVQDRLQRATGLLWHEVGPEIRRSNYQEVRMTAVVFIYLFCVCVCVCVCVCFDFSMFKLQLILTVSVCVLTHQPTCSTC